MYFPYLRGKQEELLALLELSQRTTTGLVVPIIRPVNLSSSTVKRLDRIMSNGMKVILLVNSADGSPPPTQSACVAAIGSGLANNQVNLIPALEIRAGSTLADLASFSRTFSNRRCALVHRNHTFTASQLMAQSSFSIAPMQVYFDGGTQSALHGSLAHFKKVILRDGFQRQPSNGLYPASSHFGDLFCTYAGLGFDGFGDFGPVGDFYVSGGGAARHVALHLTEYKSGQASLVMNHFVSTTPPTTKNPAQKYFDALSRLVAHVGRAHGQFSTAGVAEFLGSQGSYPGLGKPKRWSIMHHLELTEGLLHRAGAKVFL